MLKRLLATATVLAAVTAGVTACSDDPDTSPGGADGRTAGSADDGETTGDSSGPSGEDVRAFFEALASSDVTQMEDVRSLAAPGSVAALYLEHQTALSVALRDGGSEAYDPERLTKKGDGFESCSTADKKDEKKSCSTYGDIQSDGDKISSFTVNGKDLRNRLLAGGKKRFKAGDLAEIRLVTAYQSVNGDLYVALDLRNTTSGAAVAVESRTAYRTPEGRQVQLAGQSGPTSVQADSMAHIALAFAAAEVGGELNLQLFVESGGSQSAEVRIPLK
ncbi:hypothetical protein [Nocardioides sp. LML1-1-1.1]|uniref:hypothetical protein n=1 Tax=Nocardioides sp. LML1-1-1.1 TaxID=3135248 RepID=UPI003430DCB9